MARFIGSPAATFHSELTCRFASLVRLLYLGIMGGHGWSGVFLVALGSPDSAVAARIPFASKRASARTRFQSSS